MRATTNGPDPRSAALLVGVLAWAVQPLYVLIELVAAAGSAIPYSLLHQTISDLGASTCTQIDYPYGPVPVCSPRHALVNTAFIGFGLLLGLGAVLLRRRLGQGGWGRTSVVALVVAGLSSIGTGLTPLDQVPELHVLVSTPTFLAQPVGLIAAGVALRGRHRPLALAAVVTGVVALLAGVAFFLTSASPAWGGLLERLALWPAYGWLAACAVTVLRGRLGPV